MQFSYINYKKSFLKSLEYIKNDDKKNVELAKKALNLKKIFYYNQSATIGENNYYFYKICLQLFPKINEIYQYYQLYYNLIERMISFISIENFDDLNDDQLFFFNYISEIILDKKTLTTHSQLEKINNFLFGKVVDENNVISSISEMTPYIENTDNISFDLKFDEENHKLKFIIKENNKINRHRYSFSSTKSYDLHNFNENIIKIIEKNFDYNFEKSLFENTLAKSDKQYEFSKDIKEAFFSDLARILSFPASKKFFQDTYKKRFPSLEYHFDKPEIIEDIFKKIQFVPLYNIINSIPGKIVELSTLSFNRKILHLGRILVYGLHEILGQYLRRYYSLLTGNKISFTTIEDKDLPMGKEGEIYIETEFLGLRKSSYLAIEEALGLLYSPAFDNNYPILKNFEINSNSLKQVIDDNKDIFDFIQDNKNEGNFKLDLEDYI